MAKSFPETEAMRDAYSRLYDAKGPVQRGRCMRAILSSVRFGVFDFVDTLFSLSDPVRSQNRMSAHEVIREHPGKVTLKMEDDLRKNIAAEQRRGTFPKNPFGDW